MGKKKIAFIATGGTIASISGHEGMRPAFTEKEMIELVPELSHIAEIEGKLIMNIDSSNMQPEDWPLIAQKTAQVLENCDGAVISHGTDTLAYTSSALTYMLTNLTKPVVITGSQKSIGEEESDAATNLVDSFNVAASGQPGVFVVFDGQIIMGDRASKIKTESFDAFTSINAPLVGQIQRVGHTYSKEDGDSCRCQDTYGYTQSSSEKDYNDKDGCSHVQQISVGHNLYVSEMAQECYIKWDLEILEKERSRLKKIWKKLLTKIGSENLAAKPCECTTDNCSIKEKPAILYDSINPGVLLIKLYPGINPDVLLYARDKGYHSVLIESYGAGGVSFRKPRNLIPAIEELISSGITVAVTSQVPFEGVDLARYEVGKKALEAGAISTGDITREAALVRLMMGCVHL
ncbi:MAG: asparaginase [Tepidanaerobacteraceae bacterium]|jgi:L-asparaginase/Glu-tRNA(Gln) amidotransferase subunit D